MEAKRPDSIFSGPDPQAQPIGCLLLGKGSSPIHGIIAYLKA